MRQRWQRLAAVQGLIGLQTIRMVITMPRQVEKQVLARNARAVPAVMWLNRGFRFAGQSVVFNVIDRL